MSKYTNSVLSKIVAITNDRDTNALEISLAKSLYHLIHPVDGDKTSVTIYRENPAAHGYYSKVAITSSDDCPVDDNPEMCEDLRAFLGEAFLAGDRSTFHHKNSPVYTFYPLKNASDETMALIGIGILACDIYMYETITMLLQIYQNFTKLISESENDALTGLLNRKSFNSKISKLLTNIKKTSQRREDKVNYTYYLAMFDIDHFKKVNDKHGHLVGDEVLLTFADLMRQCFRNTDMIFRFGGEEFVVIFSCVDPTDMDLVLKRFSNAVKKHSFNGVEEIQFSSGYTKIRDVDTALKVVERADTALYYAKNNGRNQNCSYDVFFPSELSEITDKK